MVGPTTSYPAKTLPEVWSGSDPDESLEPDDPRWVDLSEARSGFQFASTIAWRIAATSPGVFYRQLITGHRGSGKSTELKQLRQQLVEDGFYAVYFDAWDIIEPADVEHVDVLLSIAQAVYLETSQTVVNLDERLLTELERWFNETILTSEDRADIEALVKAEAGAEVKIPPLLRIFLQLTGQLKSSMARRREIREKIDRQFRIFLTRLNELLNHVQVRLQEHGWKSLVVLVDNLEKLPYLVQPNGETNHSLLFVHHAEQLKSPDCHLIYTVPISLVFNANLGADYSAVDVIPMVKLTESDGVTPCETGRSALFQLVARRAQIPDIFANAEQVHRLISSSGGVVRDLMKLTRFACEDAGRRRNTPKIDQIATDYAIRSLAFNEYERLIQEADIERLLDIGRRHFVAGDDALGRLLFNRLVLEYRNHELWFDLHPLVRASRHLSRLDRPHG